MAQQPVNAFRQRALMGWYQALYTSLLRKVTLAARREGLNKAPGEENPSFRRLALAEAPGLYEEIVRIRERL